MASPVRKRRDKARQRLKVTEASNRQKVDAEAKAGPFAEASRSDLVMIGLAVRKRWPVPIESRPRIIQNVMDAMKLRPGESESESDRRALTACRVGVDMVRVTIEDEQAEAVAVRARK